MSTRLQMSYFSENITEEQKKSTQLQMLCIPVKTSVRSKHFFLDVLYTSENIRLSHLVCFKLNQNAAKTGVLQKRKSSPLKVKLRGISLIGTGRCYLSGGV